MYFIKNAEFIMISVTVWKCSKVCYMVAITGGRKRN